MFSDLATLFDSEWKSNLFFFKMNILLILSWLILEVSFFYKTKWKIFSSWQWTQMNKERLFKARSRCYWKTWSYCIVCWKASHTIEWKKFAKFRFILVIINFSINWIDFSNIESLKGRILFLFCGFSQGWSHSDCQIIYTVFNILISTKHISRPHCIIIKFLFLTFWY